MVSSWVSWRHCPRSPRASWTRVPVQPDEMLGRLMLGGGQRSTNERRAGCVIQRETYSWAETAATAAAPASKEVTLTIVVWE